MNVPNSQFGETGGETLPVYRFANVVVDVGRQQLWVDSVEVACQPQAFRLLVMLCEARGALVSRQILFDRLWPGGQEIGDTALTQLIWRLRGALGASAEAIKTVRRGGVRLDADVRADPLREPPATPDVLHEPPPTERRAGARPSRRMLWSVAGALVVIGVVAAIVLAYRDPLIGPDYAIYASDLDASRPETPDLLRKAFAAEYISDSGRARQLLLQIAELDAQSPVAPAMLAISSFDDYKTWAAEAQSRLRDETPPYTRLLVQLAQVSTDDAAGARQIEDAMLDLRPNAWELHLGVAHRYISLREFSLSLAAYRRIPINALSPRVAVYALSDRASLGDADVVEAALDAGRFAHSPPLEAYVRARLAYTRGRWAQAIAAADRAMTLADAERGYDNARKIAEVGAVAAFVSGSPDAADRFSHVLTRCSADYTMCATRMRSFLAVLAARAGEPDVAARRLAEAWDSATLHWERAELHFIAFEYGLAPRGTVDDVAAALATDPSTSFAGLAELLRAWQAFAAGDRDDAARRLARARVEGIARTYAGEHAVLLGVRLGEAVSPCTVDPPFPNLLRVAVCVELATPAAKKND